jgi:hypothetical protein
MPEGTDKGGDMAKTETELDGFKKVHVSAIVAGDRVALKTLVNTGFGRGATAGPVQPGFAEFEVTAAGRDGADRGWAISAKAVSGGSMTRRICGEKDFMYRRVS